MGFHSNFAFQKYFTLSLNPEAMSLRLCVTISLLLLAPLASATWVQVGPNQSTSMYTLSLSDHSSAYNTDDWSEDASVLYDGQGMQGGDAYYMKSEMCESGGSPDSMSWVDLLLTLRTNQTSTSFNLLFEVQLYISAPVASVSGPFYEVQLYNTATQSFDSFVNITEIASEDRNLSLASTYMGANGDVIVRLYSGHSTQSCTTYTEARAYEFEIFIEEEPPPVDDTDGDGVLDVSDSCPQGESGWISSLETDHDQDGCFDENEDDDDDNDLISDNSDECPKGELNWISSNQTDWDGDGCHDQLEDPDDDNDGYEDAVDICMKGEIGWLSNATSDWDSDGCHDQIEDYDDDNDGVFDLLPDDCQRGELSWISTRTTDYDEDGCNDLLEDPDDDNDGVMDEQDSCVLGETGWFSSPSEDYDQDGCQDETEDLDDDGDSIPDILDLCLQGVIGWSSSNTSDYDSDGCNDVLEDNDDDNDDISDGDDRCANSNMTVPKLDHDGDGCFDLEDIDDDGDGVLDVNDQTCPLSPLIGFDYDGDGCKNNEDLDDDSDGLNDEFDSICPLSPFNESDYDGDGCMDSEDNDDDGDGVLDSNDLQCPFSPLLSPDHDSDGCSDSEDADDDNDGILDTAPDLCPLGSTSGLDLDEDGCIGAEDACPNDSTVYLQFDCLPPASISEEGQPQADLIKVVSGFGAGFVVFILFIFILLRKTTRAPTLEELQTQSNELDELYLEQNSHLSTSWLSQEEPGKIIDRIEFVLSEVLKKSTVRLSDLVTANGVFFTMRSTIQTPAGAAPFIRAMYASVVRSHREHLRIALPLIGISDKKIKSWKDNRTSAKGILHELRQGLSASHRNPYQKLRAAGYIPNNLHPLIPSLLEQIDLLNKACHPEDEDTLPFGETEFVVCLNTLNNFVECAFQDLLR